MLQIILILCIRKLRLEKVSDLSEITQPVSGTAEAQTKVFGLQSTVYFLLHPITSLKVSAHIALKSLSLSPIPTHGLWHYQLGQ